MYYNWDGTTANEWWPGGDANNYAQYYGYTAGGRLDLVWHSDGRASRFAEYDALGFKVREGDDLNGNGALEGASTDRITEYETTYFNDGSGWWKRDLSFVYAANNDGQRTQTAKVETKLNGFMTGRIARTDSYDIFGNVTTTTTDINRSLKRVTVTVDHPDSNKDSIAVTLNGLAVERQDSAGLLYRTKYDALGRAVRSIDPRTGASLTTYVSGTSQVHRVYDALATVAYDANPSSPPTATSEYAYDAAGRVFSVAVPNPKYGVAGDTRTQLKNYTAYTTRGEIFRQWGDTAFPAEFFYDGYGRRTVMKSYRDTTKTWNSTAWPTDSGAADATLWVYDTATGNLKEKYDAANVQIDGAGVVTPKANAKKVAYTYTRTNQLKTRTWARGVTTTYNYDPVTRELLNVDHSNTAAAPDLAYTYRRFGALATVSDQATGSRTFAYNMGMALEREEMSSFYGGRRIARGYDASIGTGTNGRYNRLSVTDAAGNIDGGYDIGMTYYADGRLQTLYGFTYGYTPNSHLVESVGRSDWNYTWLRAYEAKRDLVSYSTTIDNASNLRATFACGRDVLGRMEKSTRWGEVFNGYGAAGLDTLYAYDDRSQVTADSTTLHNNSAALSGRDNYFAYDAFGNRAATLQGSGGTPVSYTPNERNQIVAIGGATLQYDDDGNLIEDALWRYVYDAENRLVSQQNTQAAVQANRVSVANARRLEYQYDYLGRRVAKFVYSGYNVATDAYSAAYDSKRVFLYDGWNVIKEFTGASLALKANYVWGLDLSGTLQGAGGVGGLLFAYDTATGRVMQPIYDHNGNVHGLIDQSGTLIARYEYDAFGNTITATGSHAAANPFRFSTKYTDTETGLVYYGLRYYSPSLGRFINRDLKEEGGGLNLYAFCRNNGVNAWDYLGMWPSIGLLPVHQWAINRVYAGASLATRSIVSFAQTIADRSVFQTAEFSFIHAMTGANINGGANFFRAESNLFISEAMKIADSEIRAGYPDSARFFFGLAVHTMQDATSPAHAGFQLWKGESSSVFDILGHIAREAIPPGAGGVLDAATRYAAEVFSMNPADRPSDFFAQLNKILGKDDHGTAPLSEEDQKRAENSVNSALNLAAQQAVKYLEDLKSGEIGRVQRFEAEIAVGNIWIGSDEWVDAHINPGHFKSAAIFQSLLKAQMLIGTVVDKDGNDHYAGVAQDLQSDYSWAKLREGAVEQNAAILNGKLK